MKRKAAISSRARRRRAFPPIAILTDFGYRDHYVGALKGVIASIVPEAPIIDLTHGIPPQAVAAGAIALHQAWRFFPARTIFLAVVDPGVGTTRRAIALETRAGARFVGPDNGVLWPAADEAGIIGAVELSNPRYRLKALSATFHGRDLFAPAAAYLGRGIGLGAFGPALAVDALIRPPMPPAPREAGARLTGTVVYVDGYGNLASNIDRPRYERFAGRFRGFPLWVTIGRGTRIYPHNTYGEAPAGAALAIFGSFGTLEVAVRDGNAAERFAAGPGTLVTVRAGRRSTDGR